MNEEKTIYSALQRFGGYVEIGENSISIPIKSENIKSARQKFMLSLTIKCLKLAPDESDIDTIAYLLQQISLILHCRGDINE